MKSDTRNSPGLDTAPPSGKGPILESWKEIAAHLHRNVRTCQLWERNLGLPVHRLDGSPKARVFAYPEELDRWREEKLHEHETHGLNAKARPWLVPALVLAGLAVGGVLTWRFLIRKAGPSWPIMDNSVAVISFENRTGDKALDIYRKIVPDRLITGLQQTQGFYVMSAERQREILKQVGKPGLEFIDSDAGFEVCRQDGVKCLVTGSFYRSGETFITDVKVLDVGTKRLLRTAKAEGRGPDSLFIEQVDDLARQIAAGQGVAKEKIEATRPASEFGTNSREAYEYYLRGLEEFYNFQAKRAIKSLEKAVEIDPGFASAYLMLADSYDMAGDKPDSLRAIEMAFSCSKKAPEKDRLLIEAEHAFYSEKSKEKGIAVLKELIAKFPKEGVPHLWLGTNVMDSDPDKAIEELNIALSLSPNETFALNSLGYIYMRRREYAKALEYFQEQMWARPGNLNSYDSLAECYFRAGMVKEARATLRKLSELPGSTRFDAPRYFHAVVEDYGETLGLLDMQLEVCLAEEKWVVYWERGFYRGWLGDLKGSLSELQLAAELAGALGRKGTVAHVLWLRSWIYLDHHELELSRKGLEEYRAYCLKERPESSALDEARYYELLGHLECEEGKTDSAELNERRMETLLPEIAALSLSSSADGEEALEYQAGLLRAEVGLAQGRTGEVIRFLKRPPALPRAYTSSLFDIRNNFPFNKDILARAYAKKGDWDKAIAEYEQLTTFDPKRDAQFLIHPKYHYRLGLLYEQKGLKAKAAGRYRKFLILWKAADPGQPEVADAKRRLAAIEGGTMSGDR